MSPAHMQLVLAGLTGGWTLLLAAAGGDPALYLAPALLIFSPLLLGRYPGERALVRARPAPARRPRPTRQLGARRRRPDRAHFPVELVRHSIAGRAPPRRRWISTVVKRSKERQNMRTRTTAAAILIAALAMPVAAHGHATVAPKEAAADGFAKLDFGIGHGCEGSPTTAIRVQIPEGVVAVKPQVVAGWKASTKIGRYETPVMLHGEQLKKGVQEVIWKGGPLDDANLQIFGMSVKLPPGAAGEKLAFPVIQKCKKGQHRWVEVPKAGESAEDLDEPAPTLTLTAAEGGHGGGASGKDGATSGDAGATDEAKSGGGHGAGAEPAAEATDAAPAAAVVAADDGSDTLAIIALVVGGLGFLMSGLALRRARGA